MSEPTLVELMQKRLDERPGLDEFFFDLVQQARRMSEDPNTQVGAVIVKDGVRAIAWNTFTGPIHEFINCIPDKFERPEKYHWFEHAERNAIYQCLRNGTDLKGASIYQNGLPCTDCARAIALSGITKVVINQDVLDAKDWKSPKYTQEVMDRSLEILAEFNVRVIYWSKNG
jgi:dCMP deaminase